MYSIKPGRAPSLMGAIVSAIFAVFGIGFTAFAVAIVFSGHLMGLLPVLFGLFFTGVSAATSIYHFRNAGAKNRFSALDITTSQEEPCPLNERFGAQTPSSSSPVEAKLSQLLSLKEKALISEAEYTAQRQRILDEI